MVVFLFVCGLMASALVAGQNQTQPSGPKPFGTSMGPAYIGGRDTDANGDKVVLDIYKYYVNYNSMVGLTTEADKEYYKSWYGRNECIGTCPQHSLCSKGHCLCDGANGQVQVYGSCHQNTSAYWAENSSDEKYRKPPSPPIPDSCYRDKKKGGREIKPSRRDDPLCQKITFPNVFDHTSQFCGPADHPFCLSRDINMYCSDETKWDKKENKTRNLCQCRKDMRFDTKNMECRIYLNVDCTYVKSTPAPDADITKMLKGEKPLEPAGAGVGVGETNRGQFTKDDVKRAFCILLDSAAVEYSSHIAPPYEFSFLGLGFGALVAVVCGGICACCCCCKCCNSVRDKIRALDPRNAMRAGAGRGGMAGAATPMAALGAVAASEYMENKQERADEARVAQMQGMQGGMPAAPPGYAPVPTGYPGAPQPGMYPPVGGQPVYPPQGAPPGYPPGGAGGFGQPGGYIPPPEKGVLGDVVNMAPELALAGAGLVTGNNTMAGLGAIAAYEKMGAEEEKEDRFKAAALKGVPPPPMGYAGGPPLAQMAAVQPENPAASANYPRQQMQ